MDADLIKVRIHTSSDLTSCNGFGCDFDVQRGFISGRAALSLPSAEIKPLLFGLYQRNTIWQPVVCRLAVEYYEDISHGCRVLVFVCAVGRWSYA